MSSVASVSLGGDAILSDGTDYGACPFVGSLFQADASDTKSLNASHSLPIRLVPALQYVGNAPQSPRA